MILSIKQELKNFVPLGISLEITVFWEIINFLGITNLETYFLSSLAIFFYINSSIRVTYTKNIYSKAACIYNTSTIKYLEMYLQFFQIIEVEGAQL